MGILVRFWGLIGALQILNLWLGLYNAEGEWPWTYFFLLGDPADFLPSTIMAAASASTR